MSDDLEAYLRGPEPLSHGDYTSLQRQALKEVVNLSPAVVEPLESRIEADHQSGKRTAQDQFDRDKGKVERDLETQRQEIQRRRDVRLAEIQADYEKQLSAIKVDAQHRRNRVNRKAVELEGKAEKEYQDQVLVAEFVADGATTKAGQKRREAQSVTETTRRQLDELAAQAQELVQLYRQSAPPSGADTESDAAICKNPDELCRQQQALVEQHLEALQRLRAAQVFVRFRPLLLAGGMLGAAMTLLTVLYLLDVPGLPSVLVTGSVAVGLVAVAAGLGGRALWRRAKHQVRREVDALQHALRQARAALEQRHQETLRDIEKQYQTALAQKDAELRKAKEVL